MPELTPLDLFRRLCRHRWMPTAGLLALRDALRTDDPRLLHDATTEPLDIGADAWAPCRAACAVGFPLWQAGLITTRAVADQAGKLLRAVDAEIGYDGRTQQRPTAEFIAWWDSQPLPRAEKLQLLLGVVEEVMVEREGVWSCSRI